MQTAKPSPTLLYHLNPKASHHWERATAVHYVDACGRTHTYGKSIQLQTPLAPLEKFSRKDYIHLTHYACNSIPNTENRAFACQSHSDLGNCSRAWCAQKACERVRKALAIKQVLKDPLDWLAITPPAPKFSLSQELSLNASKKACPHLQKQSTLKLYSREQIPSGL